MLDGVLKDVSLEGDGTNFCLLPTEHWPVAQCSAVICSTLWQHQSQKTAGLLWQVWSQPGLLTRLHCFSHSFPLTPDWWEWSFAMWGQTDPAAFSLAIWKQLVMFPGTPPVTGSIWRSWVLDLNPSGSSYIRTYTRFASWKQISFLYKLVNSKQHEKLPSDESVHDVHTVQRMQKPSDER